MSRLVTLTFLLTAAPAMVLGQAMPSPDAMPSSSEPPPGAVPSPSEQAPPKAPPPPPAAEQEQVARPPQEDSQPSPAVSSPQPGAPAGQWVYTSQYGWLWMPHAQQYTYIPGDLQAYPEMYVYYPVYGWRWVVAPWVYGYGPAPYWGTWGPRRFVWYTHPWFRVGGYWGWGGYRGWGYYRGWVGPRSWGPRGWVRAPAYYRTGIGGPHAGVVVRREPARRHVVAPERRERRR